MTQDTDKSIPKINYDSAPNNIGRALQRYVEKGVNPGSFLEAVLKNDLIQSCASADMTNLALIYDIVKWIYNNLPTVYYGSKSRYDNHVAKFKSHD